MCRLDWSLMMLRVFLVGVEARLPGRVLQLGDRVRRPHVLFAADAESVFAAGIERIGQHRIGAERLPVQAYRLLGHFEQADALDVGRGAGEILVDQLARQADRLEYLRAGVGHVGGDAHLGHDFQQALADGLDEIPDRLAAVDARGQTGPHVEQGLEREIGMDRFRAVTGKQREMMHLARRAGFDDQARAGAQALAHQVLVNRRQRQQRRNRDVVAVDAAVGDDDDAVAGAHRVLGLGAQARQARLDRLVAPGHRIGDVELEGLELALGVAVDVADLVHLVEIQHRLADLEADRRIDLVDAEQIRLRSDEAHQAHHQILADRIDRRVGHLREQLLEVVVQRSCSCSTAPPAASRCPWSRSASSPAAAIGSIRNLRSSCV